MNVKKLNIGLAIVAAFLLLLFLGLMGWRWTNPSLDATRMQVIGAPKVAAYATTQAMAPMTTAAGGIKVGWMVSLFTAEAHPYSANHFDSVTAIRPRFLDPQ